MSELSITACGVTDVGVVREHNEDAFVVADAKTGAIVDVARPQLLGGPLLVAVADGMGGENAGEVASAMTLESLRTNLARSFTHREPSAALTSSIHQAHEAIVAASASPGRTGMGATLVAALIDGHTAWVASVGDSRVYLLRDGVLSQVTRDQSLLQRLIDEGQIAPEDVASFPHKNVILQAVGHAATPTLWIPMIEVPLHDQDVLMLCSDGLSGEVDDAELCSILATTVPLDITAARLVSRANERGGNDNITVVLATIRS